MSLPKFAEASPDIFGRFIRPSRYKALHGGRGSAKSHFFAGAMVTNAASVKGFRAVCVREVQKSLKESAKRLIEDKVKALGLGQYFDIQETLIKGPGNGVILFQGMQDHTAESIKSLEGFDVAWVEEAQTISARSWEMLRPTIRAPGSEIWASWNPRNAADPVDKFFRVDKPEGAIVAKINYNHNRFFPAELEQERLLDLKNNPARYAHIWEGEYEPVAIGAIWSRESIVNNRRDKAPALGRIVVAIDPAISNDAGSDEHGIIVCAEGQDERGYVLADYSKNGSPMEWAQTAIAAYDRYQADAIVIERNQGGDMCRHTLLSTGRSDLRIIEVVATRGKHVRAEPISALYALGRVSHVGTFMELEDQMCQMTAAGFMGNGSPDRCDALVWGMTELFPTLTAMDAPKQEVYSGRLAGGWMS